MLLAPPSTNQVYIQESTSRNLLVLPIELPIRTLSTIVVIPTDMADNSKTSAQTRGNGGTGDTAQAPSKPVMQSRSQCAKQGWGSWPNFMHSYQLKREHHLEGFRSARVLLTMITAWDLDDVEEGHQILDSLRQSEFEDKMEEYQEQLSKRENDGERWIY